MHSGQNVDKISACFYVAGTEEPPLPFIQQPAEKPPLHSTSTSE